MSDKNVGYMIVKPEKIIKLLKKWKWTPSYFAYKLDIDLLEAYKLLSGQKVGIRTAWSFVDFFKAKFASNLIDWDALGLVNPYLKIRKLRIQNNAVRKQAWKARKTAKCLFPSKNEVKEIWQAT